MEETCNHTAGLITAARRVVAGSLDEAYFFLFLLFDEDLGVLLADDTTLAAREVVVDGALLPAADLT